MILGVPAYFDYFDIGVKFCLGQNTSDAWMKENRNSFANPSAWRLGESKSRNKFLKKQQVFLKIWIPNKNVVPREC